MVERPRPILRRHQQRGLVIARRRHLLVADDEKTGGVVGVVLDIVGEDVEPVELRRRLAGDGRRARLLGRPPRRFGVVGGIDPLGMGQMGIEPFATLRQRLRMGVDALDLRQLGAARHQMLVDADLHLAADL